MSPMMREIVKQPETRARFAPQSAASMAILASAVTERFRNCMHVILQHGVAKLRGFLSLASRELAGSQEHIRQRE